MRRIKLTEMAHIDDSGYEAYRTGFTYKNTISAFVGSIIGDIILYVLDYPIKVILITVAITTVICAIALAEQFKKYFERRQKLEARAEGELNDVFICPECKITYRRYEVDNLDVVLKLKTPTSNFKCYCKKCNSMLDIAEEDHYIARTVEHYHLIPRLTYMEALNHSNNEVNIASYVHSQHAKDIIKKREEAFSSL